MSQRFFLFVFYRDPVSLESHQMNHANLDSNILTMPFGIKLKRKLDIVHSKNSSFNSLLKPDWLRSKHSFEVIDRNGRRLNNCFPFELIGFLMLRCHLSLFEEE